MAFRIYTKTGDKGKTGLIGGTKVPKSHLRIESYGTVDELNSHLGLVRDYCTDTHNREVLLGIQYRLFTIGSMLATDPEKKSGMPLPELMPADVTLLEQEIDRMDATLEPMKFFILPGGHITVSTIHVARCVCRRAERICVHMQELQMPVAPIVIQYLNRLSDYLFVLARYTGKQLGVLEIPWKPR
ncbi:MAG TPA: cob(I)yrinic acid a,c-diamide adenosyltransferase [Ferruginibacter sp.]|nr:cob(I)yrinic acid a,c-diamide adenosyltransferase [Ferruginibacter sp.]HMP21509.1 cob(I)yrinic acid a,c-diamide adenosyltransferase [Ferruginibacter sp.]